MFAKLRGVGEAKQCIPVRRPAFQLWGRMGSCVCQEEPHMSNQCFVRQCSYTRGARSFGRWASEQDFPRRKRRERARKWEFTGWGEVVARERERERGKRNGDTNLDSIQILVSLKKKKCLNPSDHRPLLWNITRGPCPSSVVEFDWIQTRIVFPTGYT